MSINNRKVGRGILASIAMGLACYGSAYLMEPQEVCSCKPKRKCLLPDCNKFTAHNGGYCCAAHCKLHRLQRK